MSRQQSQQSSLKSTVSIVIPVYNEEVQLIACLDAIARQTVAPLEVIVVDNNSTDQSAAIARRYPFVRVVHEPRQGVVHARTRGFNEAQGDIIGRIDADTHLSPGWVARVRQLFSGTDIDVVSGSIGFHDVPLPAFFAGIDAVWRRFLARHQARLGELFLYGANMAIGRKVWQDIRHTLCTSPAFHEDVDMAAHLAHTSYKVAFEDSLRVTVSARRVDNTWSSYYAYTMANSKTYAAHGLRSRFYMYPIEWFALLGYIPFRLAYRSYDASTGRLSLRRLFHPAYKQRVSPVVDATS